MNNFKIFSDSASDLPKEWIMKYDVDIVPIYITFDKGITYLRESVDITIDELYDKLSVKGVYPKTSLPSVEDYAGKFRPYLEVGRDCFCVCLSSEFSGSYQSAVTAATMLLEEFPERRIKVVDSRACTYSQGLLIADIGEYRSEGKSIEEVYHLVESYKNDYRFFFTLDTLEYLEKGGRIGKVAALAGSILNIKPVIVFRDGTIFPHSRVRGRKKSIIEAVDLTAEFLKGKMNEYRIWALSSRFENDLKDMIAYAKEKGIHIMGIGKIGAAVTVYGGLGMIGFILIRNRPLVFAPDGACDGQPGV